MHRYSRMHLSSKAAIGNLRPTYRGEKSQLAELLAAAARRTQREIVQPSTRCCEKRKRCSATRCPPATRR